MLGRDNNFNLIRFLAATLVIYSHSYPIALRVDDPLSQAVSVSFANLAVDIFFVTSGFLVAGSLIARKRFTYFLLSRILRIFPALIAAVLFCAFVVGGLFTKLPASLFLTHPEVYDYLFSNIALLDIPLVFTLPGVFEDNPFPGVVNGSLLTLPWEVRMYGILVVIGLLTYTPIKILNDKQVARIIILIAVMAAMYWAFYQYTQPFRHGVAVEQHARLAKFMSLFFSGSSFYVLRDRLILDHRIVLGFSLVLVCLSLLENTLWFRLSYYVLITYIVIYFAYVPQGWIRNFNHYGDYSYGIYIYAFPVQQMLVARGPGIGAVSMFFASSLFTFILAMISWKFIESPALSLKDRFPRLLTE
jgi:peptidoglycan/LPS O-acetylase OafA/YrhL